jgi:HD-like signal output (HDOD) protein
MINAESALKNMPVFPGVASELMQITEDRRDLSFKTLENLVKRDPGLTTKILKVANSAMFARSKEVNNLQTAISMLGFTNIKNLAVMATASSMFSKEAKMPFYQGYWKMSLLSAFFAKGIAKEFGDRIFQETAFLAGLLHRIGQVALFRFKKDVYETIVTSSHIENIPIFELERLAFQSTHRDVGKIVLEKWNFPEIFVDCAKEYGNVNIVSSHKTLILVISVADKAAEYGIDEVVENPKYREDFKEWAAHLGSKEEKLLELLKTTQKNLSTDPFYQECTGLFQIKA